MANESENEPTDARITVEASSIDGVVDALGVERAGEENSPEPSEFPEELLAVLQTLDAVYRGVETATEHDDRGRSRKMVRQYADLEDLSSNDVGYMLRVLEIHDLVVQDGNRWRLSDSESAE